MSKKNTSKFSFIKPAVYKIKVQGDLHQGWSERLGGLQIKSEESEDKESEDKEIVSVLIGQINDQAALSGVLNTLYENHMTIISVNMLKQKDE